MRLGAKGVWHVCHLPCMGTAPDLRVSEGQDMDWDADLDLLFDENVGSLLSPQFGSGAVPGPRRIHPPGEHICGRR